MTLPLPLSESPEFDPQELFHTEIEQNHSVQIDEEQQYRAAAYALIGALLRHSPDRAMLQHLSALPGEETLDGDDLMLSMSMLGLSARVHTPETIEDEYHNLFIGLGKGEIVPYASWYLTGFLMEKPLSELRDDLDLLGYERSEETSEPEDHAAALCEVISCLIGEGNDIDKQRHFFQRHIVNWIAPFFNDLSEAQSAVFYKAVGRFGKAFIAFENEYFSMQS